MPDLALVRKSAAKAREWVELRDQAIRAAVNDGATLRAVGDAAGLSHTAVAKIVRR